MQRLNVGFKKIFLDVNVILDFIDDKRLGHHSAKKLIEMLVLNAYKIFMSEDMLSTIFYIYKEKRKTLEFFKVIQDKWVISPFGKDIVQDAIELSLKHNLDLEDVLQCLCAKENGCDVLITNDKKFYDCGIEICAVDDFLKKME